MKSAHPEAKRGMPKTADRALVPGWPLVVAFMGLPMWWLLGVWQLMFFIMAAPMLLFLMRHRTILMPRGFGIWFIFLGWLLFGLLVMQVEAPGTVPGTSLTRYLPFGYRYAWYVAATMVALYLINARPRISSEQVSRILAWFFVILVAGGLLGIFLPNLSFPSVLQVLMPRSLAQQAFVRDLLQVQVAQVQTFLGDPQARPSAPFPYTNDWGLVVACTLPFFVAAWWNRGRGWRAAMVPVLGAAAFTIVSSLNRGTWLAILVMVAFLVARSAVLGRWRLLVLAAVALATAVVVAPLTPLGELVQARLDNPHSDQVRSNLGLSAVSTAAGASPIVGFGTTRDVDGNFASIAGGATAACPNCTPPPLGTHGQLWLLVFGAGFVGAALYIIFLVGQLLRGMRTRTPYGVAALCTLVTLTVTLPIYSVVGVGLYIGFVCIGLLAQEHRTLATVQDLTRPLLRHSVTLVACILLGGAAGVGVHAALGAPVTAQKRMVIPDADLVGVLGARPTTLDTEARIATSDAVVQAVAEAIGAEPAEVRDRLAIGAETNTRVLVLSYASDDETEAVSAVDLAAANYLGERRQLIKASHGALEERLDDRQAALLALHRQIYPLRGGPQSQLIWARLNELQTSMNETGSMLLDLKDESAGRAISSASISRSSDPALVRVASGLALGFLLGVFVIRAGDRILLRFGNQRLTPVGLDLPVISRISATAVDEAVRAVRGYLPISGVLADPDDPSARRMAAALDERLSRHSYRGDRAVYVVSSSSRVSRIRQLCDDYASLGVHPVGVIVRESSER